MKLLNCVLYLVLTALIGFFAGRIIPKKWLNPYAGIFCSFKFEQDGKLYEKLGFSEIGRRKNYYRNPREDALIMRKEWEI